MVDEHEKSGGNHYNDEDEGEVEFLEAEQDGEAQEPQDTRRLGQGVESDRDVLERIYMTGNSRCKQRLLVHGSKHSL